MATKSERREKNRRKRRFMSDWKESIPGIVIVTILLLLGEFIDKRVYLTLCIGIGLIKSLKGTGRRLIILKRIAERGKNVRHIAIYLHGKIILARYGKEILAFLCGISSLSAAVGRSKAGNEGERKSGTQNQN